MDHIAAGRVSLLCSQASQGGLVVRPAKDVGARLRFGTGDGRSGVVGHAAVEGGGNEPQARGTQPFCGT